MEIVWAILIIGAVIFLFNGFDWKYFTDHLKGKYDKKNEISFFTVLIIFVVAVVIYFVSKS